MMRIGMARAVAMRRFLMGTTSIIWLTGACTAPTGIIATITARYGSSHTEGSSGLLARVCGA